MQPYFFSLPFENGKQAGKGKRGGNQDVGKTEERETEKKREEGEQTRGDQGGAQSTVSSSGIE
jgi:hypothetical protein